ncbi:MAG: hypothetical protein VR77_09870 [Flavobacteriales bacterium BRH_c54]|nr:MAG: hypothetical protein VR77_09870 [Flavobacteriales bacterium BRH_c54]
MACKTQEKTQNTSVKEETKNIQQTDYTPIKENLFITMERTPCLGTCPSYAIWIYNTGRVDYEGRTFAKKEGKYTKTLSKDAMDEITNMIKEIGFFNLKDKYDAQVTDLPSCIITVNMDGKKKKILDRYDGPKSLRNLEKLIDHHVLDDELIKVEELK